MKKLITLSSSVVLASMLFTGCGIKMNEYNVSADNVSQLRNYENVKISVKDFTATKPNESSVLCRMADTVSTPKGEPFEAYIKDALISELKMANMYDGKSQLQISGNVEKVAGSTTLGDAYWQIALTVTSSNGQSLKVDTKREYPSAFLASSACNNMATSFSPTVKQLINDIINHPNFPKLLGK